MNYKENIAYRKQIEQKVFDGKKVSKEERLWLDTTPLYNEKYEEPRLQRDIIELIPNQRYNIKIVLEHLNSEGLKHIIPVVSVVGKNGEIVVEHLETDNPKKPIKVLGVSIDNEHPTSCISIRSSSGFMSVEYECYYYKEYSNVYVIETSYTANLSFAMIKTKLAENKIRYECKSPLQTGYDALVFTVEWVPNNK